MTLFDDLVLLRDCVAGELTPSPGRVALVPDTPPIHDECCEGANTNGQMTINLVSIGTDNSALQGADPARSLSCPPRDMQTTVSVEVIRCVNMDQVPPPVEEQEAQVELFLADRAAVARAVRCCFAGDRALLLGQWEPVSPQGGCGGGRTQVTFGFVDPPC